MRSTRTALVLLVSGVAVVAVAVVASDEPGVTPGQPVRTAAALPPDDVRALGRIFDPLLEPAGLRLARGSLQDGPGARYDETEEGRHLALYVEPLNGEHTPAQYLETLVASAKVFLPRVFDQWPGLVSVDVCQEPPPGVDDRKEPPPVTVLEVTREEAETVVWETLDLPALVVASDEGLVSLFVYGDAKADPVWVEAEEAADRRKVESGEP